MNAQIQNDNRYNWIDTLRFLGIFAIYLGHFGNRAGKLYLFVFSYHVPLFFFVSGFFALKDKHKGILEYVIKKFKQLMIPYVCFSIISVIFYGILRDLGAFDILRMIKDYSLGIRNTLVSGGLWFIPCIFIVSNMYFILYKLLKNNYAILVGSIIIFIISRTLLPQEPSWIMNIDSAMYYILYYAIGNISFQYISNFSFKKANLITKFIVVTMIVASIILTSITYFKGISLPVKVIHRAFTFLDFIPLIYFCYSVFVVLNIIFFNIVLACLVRNIKVFQQIGRNTLILCGVENITKVSIQTIMSIFGITITISNPLACIFYTSICLIIAQYIMSEIVQKYVLTPVMQFKIHNEFKEFPPSV